MPENRWGFFDSHCTFTNRDTGHCVRKCVKSLMPATHAQWYLSSCTVVPKTCTCVGQSGT